MARPGGLRQQLRRVLAGLAECLVVQATAGYWPPRPATALALLAVQSVVLLTLAVLLATAVSPMASGVVAVGLFGTTWVARGGGGISASLGHDSVARVGTVSRMLLPAEGLWRGGDERTSGPLAAGVPGRRGGRGVPLPQRRAAHAMYLVWAAVWVARVWGVAAASFLRKDL